MERLRTVVIGLGPTGLACVRYLIKRGIPVAVTDSREDPPCFTTLKKLFPDIEVAVGKLSKDLISSAEQLVVSPGVSCKEPLIAKQIKKNIPVIGDIELFARENTVPVLAITGSNGKTTVTTILGQMIERAGYKVEVCGNIGPQVLELLDKPKPDFYVVELSSFQLETTRSLTPSFGATSFTKGITNSVTLGDAAVKYNTQTAVIPITDCQKNFLRADKPFESFLITFK